MLDNFSNQRKRDQISLLQSNEITAGASWTRTVKEQPAERAVDCVWIKFYGTLATSSSGATGVVFNSDDAREVFLDALIARIQATHGSPSLSGIEAIQTMTLGQHYDGLRSIGVKPIAPQIFGHYGNNGLYPRVGFTPGAKHSTFVLEYPILVCNPHPDLGNSAVIGADQLHGLTFSATMGSLSFVDSAGTTWTIGGADGAGGTYFGVEIDYTYRDLPAGVRIEGNPICFGFQTTTDTDYVTVNPQRGALLGVCMRLPSATSLTPPDSPANIARFVYGAQGMTPNAFANYRIKLKLDGCEQPDFAYRDLYELTTGGLYDLPGVEAGQNEFVYTDGTTIVPSPNVATQGGLMLAGLFGDAPLNRILMGKLELLVPTQLSGARQRIFVEWRKAEKCMCDGASVKVALSGTAPGKATAGPAAQAIFATLGSVAYGEASGQ
jgi:hypothetical protein